MTENWKLLYHLQWYSELKNFASSLQIPPYAWHFSEVLRGWISSWSLNHLAPGIQGEGEVWTNHNGKVKGLALAGQCLAEVHALGGQGGIYFIHCSHFVSTSEL